MPGNRVGLDNPVFAGRLRSSGRGSTYERRAAAPVHTRGRTIGDIRPAKSAGSGSQVSPKPAALPAKPRAGAKPGRRAVAPAPLMPRQRRSNVLKRQAVKARPTTGLKQRRKMSAKSVLLSVMAATLFVVGLGIGISSLKTDRYVAAQVQRIAETNESSDGDPAVPSETRSDGNVAGYKVAPTLPRVISIPKLNVEARVLRIGVKANNELKSPANIFDTGWYEGSAKPGEAGAVLIDGHVSGPTQRGVFYGLKTLVAGDRIIIERGDGTTFNYRVHSVKTYDADKVDMAAALTPVVAGKPGLNVITCAGPVDETGTGFTQRTVLFAVQE